MSLGVIPIFWFEFLSDFWRKSQKGAKKENYANRALTAVKCFAAVKAASLRQGRGRKMATHRFSTAKQCFAAAKALFTQAKIFILFSKVPYSYIDCLGTLINDYWGSK